MVGKLPTIDYVCDIITVLYGHQNFAREYISQGIKHLKQNIMEQIGSLTKKQIPPDENSLSKKVTGLLP